jgi:hypothetical protein
MEGFVSHIVRIDTDVYIVGGWVYTPAAKLMSSWRTGFGRPTTGRLVGVVGALGG